MQAFYPTSKVTTIGTWWLKEKSGADSKFDVKSVGFVSNLTPKVTLAGDFGKNSIKTNGSAPIYYHARLTYGAAQPAKPDSWSLLSYVLSKTESILLCFLAILLDLSEPSFGCQMNSLSRLFDTHLSNLASPP